MSVQVLVLVLELSVEAHMGVEGARWPLKIMERIPSAYRTKFFERSIMTLCRILQVHAPASIRNSHDMFCSLAYILCLLQRGRE